jgi:hypothetical protein
MVAGKLQSAFSWLFLLVLLTGAAEAQIFRVQGGASQLLQADGGSVDIIAPNYNGNVGMGFFAGRFEFGATAHYRLRDYTLTAGDDFVPFTLPTDIFDPTHYFAARGFSLARSNKISSLYVLAGVTSVPIGTGFFRAAHSDTPAGAIFYQRKLSDSLRFVSRNIFSDHQTSIQGVEWEFREGMKASFAGGLGSDRGYAATTFEAQGRTMLFRAGYIAAGDSFRRVTVVSPLTSEVEKENIEFAYQPKKFFSFSAGRHHLLEPLSLTSAPSHATVNEAVANFHVGRTYFGTGLFQSSLGKQGTVGTNLYGGRRFGERLDLGANLFSSRTSRGQSSSMLTVTSREKITQRISLLQLMSRASGQTSLAFGGEMLTNRFAFRADYQNVYNPFRPDRPFQQALALNVMVRLLGPLQLTAASNVGPDGRVRYSIGANTYLYRVAGMFSWQGQAQDHFTFPKYVVQGVVRDADGQPVRGIAVYVGKELAYTDDEGRFMVRLRKRTELTLQVALDQFMIPGNFEVVQAPATVMPDEDGKGQDVGIVLRRVRPKTPPATPTDSGSPQQ